MAVVHLADVLDHLPHAFPFRFVDRVIEYTPGLSLTAAYAPSQTPVPFRGAAAVPEVCVMEGLAQTTVLLVVLECGPLAPDEIPVLGSLSFRMSGTVDWEDDLLFRVELVRMAGHRGVFAARASTGAGAVAEGNLTVARSSMGGDPTC